ncbi:MAG: MoxR family ATPase, partial [Planctomycetes bacterium]|nr:MoxR family ATPase [Planctomycetota bacterium]
LADEINRTPPKTQAALLEAMQELQVTVGRRSHPLPDPFFVLATQNPIEQEGTYPLPEAQLDRFMFRIPVVYPSREEEERIISDHTSARADAVAPVVTEEEVRYFQGVVEAIVASPDVIGLAARLVRSTRPREEEAPQFVRDTVEWGAGPRAGQALVRGARALAALDGRANVAPADILRVATPVLAHRITLNYTALAEGATPEDLVARLVGETGLPEARKYGNLLRGGATG